jgi:hypothetical protein
VTGELPPDPGPRIGAGPWGVLSALASGQPGAVEGSLRQQREFFRERNGCYPEELIEVCPECHQPDCPLWAGLADRIRTEPGIEARVQLAAEHEVTDDPCTACGGIATCNMFFCYREE